MKCVRTIKSTATPTTKFFGMLDDEFETKKEFDKIDLGFFKDKALIFIDEENQAYQIRHKDVIIWEK